MQKSISIVIPAYNEEARIRPTLERLWQYLQARHEAFEIIVVDDGSTDNTAAVVNELGTRLGHLRLLGYSPNVGKGWAVKTGVLATKGSLVLLCDADLSTPIEELEKLIHFLDLGYDIAIGSRGLRESEIIVRQPWYRERMGKTFNVLVRALVLREIKDTQCGFKLFTSEVARRLFTKSRLKGFGFDVEILFLAGKAGNSVKEVPVRWIDSPNSRVTLIKAPLAMLFDLFTIRANWLSGRYNK